MSYHVFSNTNNSFVWFPIKTASTLASWIFAHFDFGLYFYVDEISEFKKITNDLSHFGHSLSLHPNHENMSFICTMRHPYNRVLSLYKSTVSPFSDNLSSENFDKFIDYSFYKRNLFRDNNVFSDRKPNFIIRSESFYEDILKIPFIKNSKLHQCGILEEMCSKEINKSFDLENENEFLTHEIKNKIYKFFEPHFELFGYEK